MEHGRLSLTRKPHQQLLFQYTDEHGNQQEITLSISHIKGEQIRMAIDAPKTVKVLRGELSEAF